MIYDALLMEEASWKEICVIEAYSKLLKVGI